VVEEGMGTIAKLSRQDAARVESMPGFEGRYVEADGYVLGFESFDQAADFTPMYRASRMTCASATSKGWAPDPRDAPGSPRDTAARAA
jgi:hypothetical protein